MKHSFRSKTVTLLGTLLIACSQATQLAPVPSATSLPTDTAIPQTEATPTVDRYALPTLGVYAPPMLDGSALPTFSLITPNSNIPSPTPNPNIPTIIPTLDPNLVSDLLRNSISIQALAGPNGHKIKRITGWDYGIRQESCYSFQWLDSNHILFYPRTGQVSPTPNKLETLGADPVVINITSREFWLPPLWKESTPSVNPLNQSCNSLRVAQHLGITINQEKDEVASNSAKDIVSTYTFGGQKIAQYNGKISGVSPSAEKILVNDQTIIDLRNNKIINLNWQIHNDPAIPPNFYINSDPALPINLYWSSDETRLYRCCFYFADMKTGKSYNFNWNDLHGADGEPLPTPPLPHTNGRWVRNNDYFLIEWNYFSDMSADYIPMFSPAEMNYYDLVTMAGIPKSQAYLSTATYAVSPNGASVWIEGFGYDGKYYDFLINLTSFTTTTYDKATEDFEWSPDSKFAQLTIFDFPQTTSKIYILSEAQNTLSVFPTEPTTTPIWRPSDHILAYLTKQNQTLDILDPQDMSVEEWKLPSTFDNLIWSPDGNHIALVATDGSLWQTDYPNLENLEQLTEPISAGNIQWSPDSKSIAFVSGKDIYIVDVVI